MQLTEIISTLPKRGDTSCNAKLTKARYTSLWNALSASQKRGVMAIAGVTKLTATRVRQTGYISPGLALALANVTDTDPLYVTGDAKEQGTFGDEAVDAFLCAKGLTSEAASVLKEPAKRGPKPKTAEAPAKPTAKRKPKTPDIAETFEETIEEIIAEAVVVEAIEEAIEEAVEELAEEMADNAAIEDIAIPEEEVILLLRSLIIRARYNDIDAEILTGIKRALIY
jgi:hypothetical protein